MSDRIHLSWDDIENAARDIAMRHAGHGIDRVFGIPQGGTPVAALVAATLGVPHLLRDPLGGKDSGRVFLQGTLVVDDLVDSGRTAQRYLDAGMAFDACYRKPHSPASTAAGASLVDGWAIFPWERATGPEDAVVRLIEHVGEDPSREGLLKTPARVVKAFGEMTEGYAVDVEALLATTFDEHSDEMVVLGGIEFTSLCEHHLLPFRGVATVGYVPDQRVVGLSKMARLVDAYARRFQVQERMTTQIADAMWTHLRPLGVGVVLQAHHSCMGVRGVRKQNATMTTSAMLGIMKHSDAARSEFLRLANGR
jgi:GTP cyclohydrolase I